MAITEKSEHKDTDPSIKKSQQSYAKPDQMVNRDTAEEFKQRKSTMRSEEITPGLQHSSDEAEYPQEDDQYGEPYDAID